ncbi:hypothetical protein GCM10009410_04020 [Shewanella ulleungensis]|uniref:Uncharacterized protein n=1 Tax=Shewanella ulleungensis TaxID=2282699 RepID=A0ABQ2QER4_9GAMM|nr:hypothetical protein GCM10009410_04020 [Shewanella ulleungensis]
MNIIIGQRSISSIVYVLNNVPQICSSLSSLLRTGGLNSDVFSYTDKCQQYQMPSYASCLELDVILQFINDLEFHHQYLEQGITILIFLLLFTEKFQCMLKQ